MAEAKESPISQVRKLYTEVQRVAADSAQVDLFFQEVRHFAMYSIVVGTREPVVEKTIKFIASLCTYPAGIADKERERREKENQGKETGGKAAEDMNASFPLVHFYFLFLPNFPSFLPQFSTSSFFFFFFFLSATE